MGKLILLGVALLSIFTLVAIAQEQPPAPSLLIITSSSSSSVNNNCECLIDEEGTYYYSPQIPSGGLSFELYDDCPAPPFEGAIINGDGIVLNARE
jgi:hypothetical protein